MKDAVYEGKIVKRDFPQYGQLFLEPYRKPESARMSLPIDSLFNPFIGKTVKITVKTIEEGKAMKMTVEEVKG